MFDFYKVDYLLLRPLLATCSEGSIWDDHVIKKAQKEIKMANSLEKKHLKSSQKWVGPQITEEKRLAELQGLYRSYAQRLGHNLLDIPNTCDDVLAALGPLKIKMEEMIEDAKKIKPSVFMRDPKGRPVISSHMILGNLKANARVLVNNGDKTFISSKVSVGEVFSLDVKAVEDFLVASKDILTAESKEEVNALPICGGGKNTRDSTGRVLLERPVLINRQGVSETAIKMSEQLPVGTEFTAHLRVRKSSPINERVLNTLLSLGKNQGLGEWRGSGGMGSFAYKLMAVPDFVDNIPAGWH